jgi:hypothetical protein
VSIVRWYDEGDRVMYRGAPCLVVATMFDAFGQDVEIMPEAGGDPFWVGHDQLVLDRAAYNL